MQEQSVGQFKVEIKPNEFICWQIKDDWRSQLIAHLKNYIAFPRHKSSTHLNFAKKLQILAEQATQPSEIQELLRKLHEKPNIVPKGRNRKTSYLYTLCDYAFLQYFNNTMLHYEYKNFVDQSATTIATLKQQLVEANKTITQARIDNEKKHKDLSTKLAVATAKLEAASCEKPKTIVTLSEMIETLPTDRAAKKPTDPRIFQLEEQNKKLRTKNEELTLRTQTLQATIDEAAKHADKKTLLANRVIVLETELTGLRKAYQSMIDFFHAIFDKSFGRSIKEIFPQDGKSSLPQVTETQKRLIRTITVAKTEGFNASLEGEVQVTAARLKNGEDCRTSTDKFKEKLKDFPAFFNKKTKSLKPNISLEKINSDTLGNT